MKLIAISAQFSPVCGHNLIYPKGLAGYMEEETMASCIQSEGFEYTLCLQLNRIANTLERLLKSAEMSP